MITKTAPSWALYHRRPRHARFGGRKKKPLSNSFQFNRQRLSERERTVTRKKDVKTETGKTPPSEHYKSTSTSSLSLNCDEKSAKSRKFVFFFFFYPTISLPRVFLIFPNQGFPQLSGKFRFPSLLPWRFPSFSKSSVYVSVSLLYHHNRPGFYFKLVLGLL